MEDLITQTVIDETKYDGGDFVFRGKLDEVIASLTAIRDSIPEEHRAAAMCRIDSTLEYEVDYATIRVWYTRPKTDVEKRLDDIRKKRTALKEMEKSKRHFTAEGATYPRQTEIDAIRSELGKIADAYKVYLENDRICYNMRLNDNSRGVSEFSVHCLED